MEVQVELQLEEVEEQVEVVVAEDINLAAEEAEQIMEDGMELALVFQLLMVAKEELGAVEVEQEEEVKLEN